MKSTVTVIEGEKLELVDAQKLVGGYVAIFRIQRLWNHEDWTILVNEDGIAKDLPINKVASVLARQPIFGDVVVLADHRAQEGWTWEPEEVA